MIQPEDSMVQADSSRHVPVQAHGLGCHLDVPSISYSLALLRLPQLFMGTYFVRGVETFSELAISLRRLNAFLALPEPPGPAHLQGTEARTDNVDVAHRDTRVRSWDHVKIYAIPDSSYWQVMHPKEVLPVGVGTMAVQFTFQRSCPQAWHALQSPAVELRGGDFDWDNWAGLPPAALAKQRAATAALLETPESPIRQLLHGLHKLMTAPGHNSKGFVTDNNRSAICSCQSYRGSTL